jgi:hypothetical protein
MEETVSGSPSEYLPVTLRKVWFARELQHRFIPSAYIVSQACLLASKLLSTTILSLMSQIEFFYAFRARLRPPFFPAADAICLRRSGESFAARAFPAADAICLRRSAVSFAARIFPPMRWNSEIVSGFFTPQSYHDRHGSLSAFFL